MNSICKKKLTARTVLLLLLTWIASCSFSSPHKKGSTVVDDSEWNGLLKKYVSEEGKVDYKGFLTEEEKLNSYLKKIANHPPDTALWTREEQLSYWINAYNAFTVRLILDYYPVESIKDIGSLIKIPFVNSPWDIKFIEIGGKKLDLNNIEHDILRENFNEPRIHFAINCASKSCPRLRNEAYSADRLERQLQEQAIEFINDPTKNQISRNNVEISPIFKWFQADFTQRGSLIDFLNKYAKEAISSGADVSFGEYDWSLND